MSPSRNSERRIHAYTEKKIEIINEVKETKKGAIDCSESKINSVSTKLRMDLWDPMGLHAWHGMA